MRDVADGLAFFVLLLELTLHVKVELALTLDALLFHVSDDALMHCLEYLLNLCVGVYVLSHSGNDM